MVAEASHEMTYVCEVELCCCAVVSCDAVGYLRTLDSASKKIYLGD